MTLFRHPNGQVQTAHSGVVAAFLVSRGYVADGDQPDLDELPDELEDDDTPDPSQEPTDESPEGAN